MDEFLSKYQAQPRAEFDRSLQRKLREVQEQKMTNTVFLATRVRALAVVSAAVLAVGSVFVVPGVSASAQDFLSLFRVKRIAVVQFDPARFDQSQLKQLDPKTLFASDPVVTRRPGQGQSVGTVSEASKSVGFPVRLPPNPRGMSLASLTVEGESAASFVPDVNKINAALQLAGVSDVKVPAALDGATVSISVPKAVRAEYKSDTGGGLTFVQLHSPEVQLPDGVKLAELGEIGLRVIGMPPADAARFARSIDWNTTLVLPVPTSFANYREVTVRGAKGVLVSEAQQLRGNTAPHAMLMWSEGDVLYAMSSSLSENDLLVTANALQ